MVYDQGIGRLYIQNRQGILPEIRVVREGNNEKGFSFRENAGLSCYGEADIVNRFRLLKGSGFAVIPGLIFRFIRIRRLSRFGCSGLQIGRRGYALRKDGDAGLAEKKHQG